MINLYHLNKYNKSCSDSGIVTHQTAVQEQFLLDIIASGSLDDFNGIVNATATKQYGNWYRWVTFLKHTGIANNFWGGGSQKSRGNPCFIIRRLSATKLVRNNQETHPSEKGHTLLQKTQRTFPRQRYPPSSWKGLPHIPHREKRVQKFHSDTVVDNHNPLPSAHLGGNHHPTWLIFGDNKCHTSEHGLGGASKNDNHLTYDNKFTKGRHTFFWWRKNGILTRRSGYPLLR